MPSLIENTLLGYFSQNKADFIMNRQHIPDFFYIKPLQLTTLMTSLHSMGKNEALPFEVSKCYCISAQPVGENTTSLLLSCNQQAVRVGEVSLLSRHTFNVNFKNMLNTDM